jgi:hypothetical protein
MVTLTGAAPAVPAGARLEDRVLVCWDACDALIYSAPVHWSSSIPMRFEIPFPVPSAPWLTSKGIHQLVPGAYRITLPCLWVSSAEKPKGECGLEQRTGSFRLIGPVPSLCMSGQPCSALEVSPTEGPPGTAIAVRGWVPLAGLERQGSVHIQFRAALATSSALPTLASAPFQVKGGQDWASLGTLHPAFVLRSDIEPLGVDPANPARFAYCSEGAIQLTSDGGQSWSSVSIEGALAASAATKYPLVPTYTTDPASCAGVALDPRHPTSFYVSFLTVERGSGPPPFYNVAYFTMDTGRTWHALPVPAGSDMGGFGGFQLDQSGVRALYTYWSDSLPDDQLRVAIKQTVDGGKTWSTGTLACPPAGPCIALGTKTWGRCQAVEAWRAVLVSADNGKSWTLTNRIRSCWGLVELIGLPDGRLATLGGSDVPIGVSGDGDRTSRGFALPQLPERTDTVTPLGSLELLPDGRLLSVSLHWSLLAPGASAWCTVAGSPTGNQTSEVAPSAPQLIGDRFWWLDGTPATLHSFALSALHC